MSLLDKLKVVAWRQSNWSKLFQGDTLFTELKALRPEELEQTIQRLESYQQSLPNKLPAEQWQAVRLVLICAQIANLDEYSYAKLPGLLKGFDLPGEGPAFEMERFASLARAEWPGFLEEALKRLVWPAPLNAAWARDTIACFWKNCRQPIRSQRVTLLLLDEDEQGFTADLSLDLLENGNGTLYPDPESMSFVRLSESFLESIQRARAAVLQMEGRLEGEDVRWKIERQDGKTLSCLEGGSAGGAFALALVKLLSADL
jgi:hypothetical protein